MSTLSLLIAHKATLTAILTRYGVHSPRVFGSASRGDDTVDSDIDLLVSKSTPMSYSTTARLRREVSAALGRKVDIVFDDRLRPGIALGMRNDVREIP